MKQFVYWSRIYNEGVLDVVSRLTTDESRSLTEQFGAHNYHPLPINIVRTNGSRVYDSDGREYIDCIGSYSAVAFGHLSPFIIETVREQLSVSALTSRAVYTPELALFLEGLCKFTGQEMVCPMNTGAEAVETAIKLARKWGYTKKQITHNEAEIIVAAGNFHGRTTTIVGFSSEPSYKAGFGPFTPGFVTVPFGDITAITSAITANTAAILLEPIQAEAGVNIPPLGYLAAVRQLCTDSNILLIWDEIQTGFGRTGTTFAWEHEDACPDLMCLGKALGGGILPVSAVAGNKEAMSVFHPGDHGSTFGGNPLASVAALAAMAEFVVEGLAEKSRISGNRLLQNLREIDNSDIIEVRGRGLLIGLEVSSTCDSMRLTQSFLDAGILTKETRRHTFRFAPPLTTDTETLDEIAMRVASALK